MRDAKQPSISISISVTGASRYAGEYSSYCMTLWPSDLLATPGSVRRISRQTRSRNGLSSWGEVRARDEMRREKREEKGMAVESGEETREERREASSSSGSRNQDKGTKGKRRGNKRVAREDCAVRQG